MVMMADVWKCWTVQLTGNEGKSWFNTKASNHKQQKP
jgi:hypothetical protein